MLLASAWWRMAIAAIPVALLWAAVLWVAPSAPSLAPPGPSAPVDAPVAAMPTDAPPVAGPPLIGPPLIGASATAAKPEIGPLRIAARSGAPAPGGGRLDRFDVATQPIVAPVNAKGQVAFHATVLRGSGREGIFLSEAGRVTKMAAFGDPVPGGGTLAEFAAHPLPALNAAGHVAFTARIAGARATEGMFLVTAEGLTVIALTGDDAPGLPGGVIVGFDTPSLNDNDEIAWVASVRRGREVLDVLYLRDGRRTRRLMAEGERLLTIGGTMDKIGVPVLNNGGVVAFPAAIQKGPVLGGIFVAGARELRLLVGAGDRTPEGSMILRFSERVALDDDDGITFSAYLGVPHLGVPHLGVNSVTREAVLRIGPDGLSTIAAEGDAAPGGGRYAGFGPWPTVAPGGVTAFIAALDNGPAPLAAFMGTPGALRRVAMVGETLPDGGHIGRFALNAVAVAGPGGTLTFATMGGEDGQGGAILCLCPVSPR